MASIIFSSIDRFIQGIYRTEYGSVYDYSPDDGAGKGECLVDKPTARWNFERNDQLCTAVGYFKYISPWRNRSRHFVTFRTQFQGFRTVYWFFENAIRIFDYVFFYTNFYLHTFKEIDLNKMNVNWC